MSKYKEPLTVRDNKKDEEVRRASNPALAHGGYHQKFSYERKLERDLTGSRVTRDPEPVREARPGIRSPMPNETPEDR